ncbi:MAG: hypothetical protein IAG13_02905 [Deltaproteobacteria bacterium]|nr:hypothetical protein [Nannocystaceae bacterium]
MDAFRHRASFLSFSVLCCVSACGSDPVAATDTASSSSSDAAPNSSASSDDTTQSGSHGSNADDTTGIRGDESTSSSAGGSSSQDDDASSSSSSSGAVEDDSSSGGSSSEEGTETGEPAACGSADGMSPHTLCGVVRSQIAPDPDQDGVGILWIIATGSCGGLVNEQIIGIEDADFSEVGNEVAFEIEVPFDDTWYIAAFLDENSSGTPEFPIPSDGDMANLAGPQQLTCESAVVVDDVGGWVYELTDII